MDFLLKGLDKLVVWGSSISSAATVVITLIILLEIIGRELLGKSTMISDEYSAYFYVVSIFFGLAYTMREDGHIRIRVVTSRLSPKGRSYLDLVSTSMALGVTLFLFYHGVALVRDSYNLKMVSETTAKTPVWIPQMAIVIGLFLFILQLIGRFCEMVKTIREGNVEQ